jgi:hypothetical protein
MITFWLIILTNEFEEPSMYTQSLPAASNALRPSHFRPLITAPRVAGITYTAAWVAGLAIWPSNLNVDASGAQVVAAYAGHQGIAMVQYLLVEGVAALALAGVTPALYPAASRRGARRLGRVTLVAGLAAGILSLIQCVLGQLLAGWAAPGSNAGAAGLLFALISRMDGVKMLVLAVMAVAGVGLVRRAGILPRWLGYTGIALAVALVTSGLGYLLLNPTLAQAAVVSLPLLLLWVTGASLTVTRAPL